MESVPEEIREKMARMSLAERAQYIAEQVRERAIALGASQSVIMVALDDDTGIVTQYYMAFHGGGVRVRGLLEIGADVIRRITVIARSVGGVGGSGGIG